MAVSHIIFGTELTTVATAPESVHVRSLQIYEYFTAVAIISAILIMILYALSQKMIFAVLDV